MMLRIPDVLTKAQVGEFRRVMADAPWVDGNVTSGHQSAKVKDNMQLPEDSPAARRLGDAVLDALSDSNEPPRVVKLAVREMPRSGKPEECLAAAGIDAEHIAVAARALVALPAHQA